MQHVFKHPKNLNEFGAKQSKGWIKGRIFNNDYDHIGYDEHQIEIQNHDIKVKE